ncbi:hypothetical protein ABN034_07325 [Actinopolymorpha sp. B11F2]|uniref:hypothetical protein n=1 Tax=Actinopolymorpha sp. B11F2 TaxID=3160862 RepID=UPI0032E51D9E
MSETPVYDQLIAERLGRGPTEFEGHDQWDESDEATEAYARGVAEAEATWEQFWGRKTTVLARTPAPYRERQRAG